jgi:Spy/CpxP family protein refolding chaperone
MKTLTVKLATAAFLLMLSLPFFAPGARAFAQEEGAQQNEARTADVGQGAQDGDLIRRLKLTLDQIRQIREIRQQRAEEMRLSRQRMLQAQRALDEAIYADTASEAEVETRARDASSAQSEVVRLRALTELRIRRVLTPEQLSTLRIIREEARQKERELRRERREDAAAFQDNKRPNLRNLEKNNQPPKILMPPQNPARARGRRP